MSIATAITAAQGKVADCYTAISNKGGTLPATQNLSNMPTAISSITTSGTIDSLSITPSTSAQTITASGGVDGYSPISVSAVDSSIDANITAGNIKSGVSILGVSGTVTELKGETRSVSITSTAGNTFTPSTGKNGITSITVTPTNQAKTITPTTSNQTISVPSGYSGFGTLTVNKVTSSIDSNISAGNIKSGVSILGVSGSVTPLNGTTLSVTPSTSAQSLSPSSPYNGYTSVSVSAVTSSIDNNITAGNIKSGVSILGVIGTYGGGGGSSKYGCTIDNLLGDVDANGVLQLPSDTSGGIVFSGVKDVVNYGLAYKYYYNTNIQNGVSFPDLVSLSGENSCAFEFYSTKVTSVSFPELTSISGKNNCSNMFAYARVTSISFPKLTSISGNASCSYMFYQCPITSVSFPELSSISGTAAVCAYMFQGAQVTSINFPKLASITGTSTCYDVFRGCTRLEEARFPLLSTLTATNAMSRFFYGDTSLENVYFNSLTTTSFGNANNQFSSLLMSTGTSKTHTLHFPSNLETTIQGLSGYPLFGGSSGYVVLSFDLTATT